MLYTIHCNLYFYVYIIRHILYIIIYNNFALSLLRRVNVPCREQKKHTKRRNWTFRYCLGECTFYYAQPMCFRYIYISLRERGCNPVSESFLLRLLREMTSNFAKAPGDTVKAFDRHGSRKSQLNFRVIFHVCFTPATFRYISFRSFPFFTLPRNDCQRYLCTVTYLDNNSTSLSSIQILLSSIGRMLTGSYFRNYFNSSTKRRYKESF